MIVDVNTSNSTLAKETIDRSLQALTDNNKPEEIASWLRTIENEPMDATARNRFLRARGTALNRLGFPNEALGDLHEARDSAEAIGDVSEVVLCLRSIALVHSWRGEARDAALALLRAIAQATASSRSNDVALTIADAGRLFSEIGQPLAAFRMFEHSAELEPVVSRVEEQRNAIAMFQAAVDAERYEDADRLAIQIELSFSDALPRLRHIAALTAARLCMARGDLHGAKRKIDAAKGIVPEAAGAFEHVEVIHAEAELALAQANNQRAVELLDTVIARYAEDDLASREVAARLQLVRALDGLGRSADSEKVLTAALRRATARRLGLLADRVRSELASRSERFNLQANEDITYLEGDHPRFVRRRALGSGGSGKVMRAYDLELGVEVALKRINLAKIHDPVARDRAMKSARTELHAAKRIGHPSVAKVYALLTERNGDALLVQEFVVGHTLRSVVGGKCQMRDAFAILSHIAFALSVVHSAGIVHRDLKPDNIILRSDNQPVIIDFGIAVLDLQTASQEVIGTARYMAPEQLRGICIVKSDLYALGVIAFELVAGKLPENKSTLLFEIVFSRLKVKKITRELLALGCPEPVASLIGALLSPHPFWRPACAMKAGHVFAQKYF